MVIVIILKILIIILIVSICIKWRRISIIIILIRISLIFLYREDFFLGFKGLFGLRFFLVKYFFLFKVYWRRLKNILIVVSEKLRWKFIFCLRYFIIMGEIKVLRLILKIKILKLVLWWELFFLYKLLIIFDIFGFNSLVLRIIRVIEMNRVVWLNGVVRVIWFSMIRILLYRIVLWLFRIWLLIKLLIIDER